jgi:hypothetical protein
VSHATTTITNWLLALSIVALYAAMQTLDGPSDAQAQWDQSAALQDAIKSEATQARFTRAAAQICGNGSWTQDADGAVRCHMRKPRGAGVVLTSMDAVGVHP